VAVQRLGRNVVGAVAVTAVLAGAGLAATRLVSSPDGSGDLDRLVMRPADLPAGYREAVRVERATGCAGAFDHGEVRRLRRWGIVGCAVVKFRRPESDGDRVGLMYLLGYRFDDAAGASTGLRNLRTKYVAGASGDPLVSKHSVAAPALGDEAPRGVRLRFGGEERGSALTYWWRRGKVVAVIVVANMPRDLDQSAVLALARRIDERART
jgi:hypothetical protein